MYNSTTYIQTNNRHSLISYNWELEKQFTIYTSFHPSIIAFADVIINTISDCNQWFSLFICNNGEEGKWRSRWTHKGTEGTLWQLTIPKGIQNTREEDKPPWQSASQIWYSETDETSRDDRWSLEFQLWKVFQMKHWWLIWNIEIRIS